MQVILKYIRVYLYSRRNKKKRRLLKVLNKSIQKNDLLILVLFANRNGDVTVKLSHKNKNIHIIHISPRGVKVGSAGIFLVTF